MRPRGPEVPLGTTVGAGAGAQTSRRPRRPRLCPSAVGLTLQTAPKRRAFAAPGMLLGTEDAGGVGLALGTWASLRPAPGRGRSSWGCWGELGPRRGRSRGPPPPGGMHAASPACPMGPPIGWDLASAGGPRPPRGLSRHLGPPRGLHRQPVPGSTPWDLRKAQPPAQTAPGTLCTHVLSEVGLTQSLGQLRAQDEHVSGADTEGSAVTAVAKGRLPTPR